MRARRSLDLTVRLRLWAATLLLATLFVHVHDLSTPGLRDRTGRLKASDYMRLYVTGVLAGESRWTEFFDGDAHVRVAQQRVDPRLGMTGLHPNYSPIVGEMLAPLTALPFLQSLYLFWTLSVLGYVASVVMIVKRTRHLRSDLLTVFLSALAFPALFDTLRYGQLSAVTLLVFSGAALCWSYDRRLLAGIVLGLAVYKPNLLVGPGVVLLLAGEWLALIGLCAGAAAEGLANVLCSDTATMSRYVSMLVTLARDPTVIQIHPAELHSWRGFFQLVLPASLAGLVTVLAGAATIGLAVLSWRRSTDWRIRWTTLTLAAVLTSPHLLTYDLLLLAVPLLLMSDRLADGASPALATWLCMLGVYFCALVSPFVASVTHIQLSTVFMAWLMVLSTSLIVQPPASTGAAQPLTL